MKCKQAKPNVVKIIYNNNRQWFGVENATTKIQQLTKTHTHLIRTNELLFLGILTKLS